MESQEYCPDCGAFHIRRVHRGFIKKKILMMRASYQCKQCGSKFTTSKLAKNPMRELPELLH